jgi:hypothetical protein
VDRVGFNAKWVKRGEDGLFNIVFAAFSSGSPGITYSG